MRVFCPKTSLFSLDPPISKSLPEVVSPCGVRTSRSSSPWRNRSEIICRHVSVFGSLIYFARRGDCWFFFVWNVAHFFPGNGLGKHVRLLSMVNGLFMCATHKFCAMFCRLPDPDQISLCPDSINRPLVGGIAAPPFGKLDSLVRGSGEEFSTTRNTMGSVLSRVGIFRRSSLPCRFEFPAPRCRGPRAACGPGFHTGLRRVSATSWVPAPSHWLGWSSCRQEAIFGFDPRVGSTGTKSGLLNVDLPP